jgi:hypothetical protein
MEIIDPGNELAQIHELETIECGEEAAKHFFLDEKYTNLNHGK